MNAKEAAARCAVEYIKDGMVLGLGTGSTALYAIQAIGERIRTEGLKLRGVPTSLRSQALAEEQGIPIIDFSRQPTLDMTLDGADEVDPALNLIKGGGGALVREKIVASASTEVIIFCDESKMKKHLGAFPLPVAVLPFGWEATRQRLLAFSGTSVLRLNAEGEPFTTDDGLYIIDMHQGLIRDVSALERNLKQIVGVTEVGLFVNIAHRVVIGYNDGSVKEIARA